jgi:hypothetical protein
MKGPTPRTGVTPRLLIVVALEGAPARRRRRRERRGGAASARLARGAPRLRRRRLLRLSVRDRAHARSENGVNGWTELADRIALAIVEHGPMSCERLARVVEVRTADVRLALRDGQGFERVGAGRGSRWRLSLATHRDGVRDGLGRILSEGVGLDDVPDAGRRLRALERRVAELERRFADTGAPTE